MKQVLLDTGPLVAYLKSDEVYHEWAQAQFSQIAQPMLTCDAVMSETCYLLLTSGLRASAATRLVKDGLIGIRFDLQAEIAVVERLLDKYADQPMSLADACLVRMAEMYPDSDLLTLDSHFRIYRKHDREPIPVIMPDDR